MSDNSTLGPPQIGVVKEHQGLRIWTTLASGRRLGSYEDATDIIAEALSARASVVALPANRLGPAFFDLKTGIAGAFIQKIVNYRLVFAVIGDISLLTQKSEALADFVRESNRSRSVFFSPDLVTVVSRLTGAGEI